MAHTDLDSKASNTWQHPRLQQETPGPLTISCYLLVPLGNNEINVPLKRESLDRWHCASPPLFQLVCRRQRLFWICSPKLTLPVRVQGTHSAFLNLCSGMKKQIFQSPILKEQDMRKHISQWGVMERRKIFSSVLLLEGFFHIIRGKK